jgi:hypothetical protein
MMRMNAQRILVILLLVVFILALDVTMKMNVPMIIATYLLAVIMD